jgi:hypothetical protein
MVLLSLLSLFQCLVILDSCKSEMTYAERISPFRKKIKDPSTSMIIRLPIGTFDPLSQAGPVNLPENLRLNSYPPEVAGYYLVQFRGPVLEEWKGAVTDAGGQFFDYIPDFSFIVKMDQRTKRLVERMNSVRWVAKRGGKYPEHCSGKMEEQDKSPNRASTTCRNSQPDGRQVDREGPGVRAPSRGAEGRR